MNNKDFLIISILTFITVFAWIIFDAVHTYKTSTIPPDLKIQLEPLNIQVKPEDFQTLSDRPDLFAIIQAEPEGQENQSTESAQITPTMTIPQPKPTE